MKTSRLKAMWIAVFCLVSSSCLEVMGMDRIEGRAFNKGCPEWTLSGDHSVWSPVHFNRFDGSLRLIDQTNIPAILGDPLDLTNIIIPEDGNYSISANYYWDNTASASNSVLSINGNTDGFITHPFGHGQIRENSGTLNKVLTLNRDDKVSVLVNGHTGTRIKMDRFDLRIDKI